MSETTPTGSTEAPRRLLNVTLRDTSGAAPEAFFTASAAFSRPADTTAYAAGDLIADSTSAGSVNPAAITVAHLSGQACRIERVRLRKSGTGLSNAQFRVYLFRAKPVVSAGDNAAFEAANVLAISDIAEVVESFDIVMGKAAAAGARGTGLPSIGNGVTVTPTSGTTIYALVTALAAYTPVSGEVFTVTLEGAMG